MNAIAANTLLKTLEEPAGAMRFVLATEASHQLLPTIRSRCLTHTLAWPAQDVALTWLQAQDLSASDAQVLLQAAGGRPEVALDWAQSGLTARQWCALPQAVARGDVTALADRSPAQAVDTLQKICHDLMAVACGGSPRFFARADLPPGVPLAPLAAWWRELADMLRTSEHPFNAGLMLEVLVSRGRAALNSSRSAPSRRT